jgi:phosphotriesterase-related protein
MVTRRSFIQTLSFILGGTVSGFSIPRSGSEIMTVRGLIDSGDLGNTLIHEHILVDFIGASQYDPTRWNDDEVIRKVLPYLKELKDAGCQSLVDCTPNYLGRDVLLLQKLSELSGLNILTNTAYYGGSDRKFLPQHAFDDTADQLAMRWIREWTEGIDGTEVKPGFMKISVNPDHLSPISQKLVAAAAKTHLKTGLTIASHTGPAVAAFEEVAILNQEGVAADAFIWVHAQNENDKTHYVKAARSGMWVSLDGVNETNVSDYTSMLTSLKKDKCLHRILISHDAGWFEPGKPNGGTFRGYTTLFKKLLPSLTEHGFSKQEIEQLIRKNPENAFRIRVKKVSN